VPSVNRRGAVMPPLPVRDRESVIALAKSVSVELAQAESISVPLLTGLPAGSV
jgi:hypothetical protein